jgi:hypothetical protein
MAACIEWIWLPAPQARPIQEIRHRFNGTAVRAWWAPAQATSPPPLVTLAPSTGAGAEGGAAGLAQPEPSPAAVAESLTSAGGGSGASDWQLDAASWLPYQESNFVSPPFPDFPSGHSFFSRSFSAVMGHWFGAEPFEPCALPVPCVVQPLHSLRLISPLFTPAQPPAQQQPSSGQAAAAALGPGAAISKNSGAAGARFGAFHVPRGSSLVQPGDVPAAEDGLELAWSSWDDIANSTVRVQAY